MELSGITYFTDDVPELATFYEVFLGVEPIHREAAIAVFDVGGVTVMLHQQMDAYDDGPPNEDHPEYTVEDVDAHVDALAEGPVEVVMEPADYDWGRAAYLRDPAGTLLELVEA